MFPICIGTVVCVIFSSYIGLIIRLVIAGLAFFWSCTSSVAFMSTLVPEEKKLLAVYPCILFYLFLSWFSVLIWCIINHYYSLWKIIIRKSFLFLNNFSFNFLLWFKYKFYYFIKIILYEDMLKTYFYYWDEFKFIIYSCISLLFLIKCK